MAAQHLRVERHVDRLEPELAERVAHHLLAGLLVAERRRRLDEAHEHVLHVRGLGGDGRRDLGRGDVGGRLSGARHAGEGTSGRSGSPPHRDPVQRRVGDAAASIPAMATIDGCSTIPWDWYVDPAVARLEQERIFRRTWQYAGHTGELTEPGSFVSTRAGDVPVVLVRDRDDELRAFVNVCRHRGYLLCDGAGQARDAAVPVPRLDVRPRRIAAARRRERRSSPASTARASASSPCSSTPGGRSCSSTPIPTAGPLAEHLGDLPRLVAEGGVDVDALVFHQRAEVEYDANWKVCVENYLECYHCAVAHPSFSKAIDVAPGTYTLEEHPTFSSQFGPPKNGGGGVYDATGEVDRGQFHLLFPGTTINVMPGRGNFSIGPVVPLGAERTYRFLDYFFLPDTDEQWIADYLELDNQVGAEDRVLVERVQVGMRSGHRSRRER